MLLFQNTANSSYIILHILHERVQRTWLHLHQEADWNAEPVQFCWEFFQRMLLKFPQKNRVLIMLVILYQQVLCLSNIIMKLRNVVLAALNLRGWNSLCSFQLSQRCVWGVSERSSRVDLLRLWSCTERKPVVPQPPCWPHHCEVSHSSTQQTGLTFNSNLYHLWNWLKWNMQFVLMMVYISNPFQCLNF